MADESDSLAQETLANLAAVEAVVPQLWHYEVRNALMMGERRGHIPLGMSDDLLGFLATLPIVTDYEADLGVAFRLARLHSLTFYDALYLELAFRRSAAMATRDAALARACQTEGISTSP